MRRLHLYFGCFVLHFLLLLGISCRETLGLIANGYTMVPPLFVPAAARAQKVFAAATADAFPLGDPLRQAVAFYTNAAGIELGYGYFAPNVPDSYKLVFELHFPDGHVEHDLAGLDRAEGNLRLAGYLDALGNTTSPAMREILIKLLATSVWRQHPEAVMVRAILGELTLPMPEEFVAGAGEHYEFLNAYDFTLAPAQ